MRHQKSGRKFSRTSAHRHVMFSNMAASLIKNELIRTTLPKAKELRSVAEPLITLAKVDGVANRRLAFSRLRDKEAVGTLFTFSARVTRTARVATCESSSAASAPATTRRWRTSSWLIARRRPPSDPSLGARRTESSKTPVLPGFFVFAPVADNRSIALPGTRMSPFRWSFRSQFLLGFAACAALLGVRTVRAVPVTDPAVPVLHLPAPRVRGTGTGIPGWWFARAAWRRCAAGVVAAGLHRCRGRHGLFGPAFLGSAFSTGIAELRARPELHAWKARVGWVLRDRYSWRMVIAAVSIGSSLA